MTPREWTLLVIAAAKVRPLQPVQLQKALFLLSRNLSKEQLKTDKFYDFAAFDYGPFSSDVYQDAENLERDGLVHVTRPPVSRYKLYQITDDGLARANELSGELQEPTRKYFEDIVHFTQRLSFNQLVSAIYKAYPEMRENSVFKEEA